MVAHRTLKMIATQYLGRGGTATGEVALALVEGQGYVMRPECECRVPKNQQMKVGTIVSVSMSSVKDIVVSETAEGG